MRYFCSLAIVCPETYCIFYKPVELPVGTRHKVEALHGYGPPKLNKDGEVSCRGRTGEKERVKILCLDD